MSIFETVFNDASATQVVFQQPEAASSGIQQRGLRRNVLGSPQRSPDFPFQPMARLRMGHLFVGRQGTPVGTFRQFAAVDGRPRIMLS